jgi:hypothetical protein
VRKSNPETETQPSGVDAVSTYRIVRIVARLKLMGGSGSGGGDDEDEGD